MTDTFYKYLNSMISRFYETPQYLILFVSNKCWMKCSHCWFNEDWKCENLKTPDLTFDELKKLSGSIKSIMFLSITGGEAFGRNDIEEVIKLFTKNGKTKRYQIPTSGYLCDRIIGKTENILKQNPGIPFRVDVSLDGTEEIHDEIRNLKGSFSKAAETIKELNKLKKKFNYFDVGVITTISGTNQQIVEEISETVREIHPDGEWMVNIIRGEVRNPASKEVKPENYKKAQDIIQNRIKAGDIKGHTGHFSAKWLSAKNSVRRKTILKILRNKKQGGGCSAGSFGGVIFADGSVYPCEMLDKSFGNLRDYDFDFQRMWNSKAAGSIRDYIQDTHCLCTQECFLSINVLIQPQLWPGLVYERMKLL